MMEGIHVDFLTVLIATVIYMILGAIWYSPLLFGELWVKLKKVKKPKSIWPKLIIEFLMAYIMAFFLALVLGFLGATSTMDGIYAAVGIWLGFIATTQLAGILWAKDSIRLYFIDTGFFFIGLVTMGGILGA